MTTPIRLWLAACALVLASGCAMTPQAPPMPSAADLFVDGAFRPATLDVSTAGLFTLSAPMQAYMRSAQFAGHVRREGPARGLVSALYNKTDLKLEYEASMTRTAAGTYEARRGNCLALVIMTAAFARALNVDVNYQNVMIERQWSRSGGIYLGSSHVNLALADRLDSRTTFEPAKRWITVDFLPSEDASRHLTRPIDEQMIEVMYLNNRAAEEIAAGRLDQAYWFARAAIKKDPAYITAYNTLGVIYQRHGNFQLAERVYQRALEREREDTVVMNNLIPVLASLGKEDESKALAARLASIDPTPPFHYFHKGLKAMEAGKYAEAKGLFEREVARSPYYHEFHFWLGIAHMRLGEPRLARDELTLAVGTSTSEEAAKLYTGKLNYLRALTAGNHRSPN